MRAGRISLAAFVLATSMAPAISQQMDIATESEITAAYCIGALRTGFGTSLEQDRIQRFRAFLAARGAFTTARSRASGQGLNIAVERGYADGIACHRHRSVAACEGPDRCTADDLQIPF